MVEGNTGDGSSVVAEGITDRSSVDITGGGSVDITGGSSVMVEGITDGSSLDISVDITGGG